MNIFVVPHLPNGNQKDLDFYSEIRVDLQLHCSEVTPLSTQTPLFVNVMCPKLIKTDMSGHTVDIIRVRFKCTS